VIKKTETLHRDTVNVDPGIDKNHITGAEKYLKKTSYLKK